MTKTSFKYKDNKGSNFIFELLDKEIIDSKTKNKINPNWHKKLDIHEDKLFLVGKLIEDAIIKKAVITHFPLKEEKQSALLKCKCFSCL